MKNELFVWDIDGTLTRTNGDWEHYKTTLNVKFGIPIANISDDFAHYPNITDSGVFRTVCERHNITPTNDQYLGFIAHYVGLTSEHNPEPIAGAAELMGILQSKALPTAVATGAWQQKALRRLGVVGITPARTPIATAHDHMTRCGIMETALSMAQSRHRTIFDKTRIVYVGDADWDAAACAQLGWRFVARCEKPEKFARFGVPADAIIPDYTDQARFWAAVRAARVPNIAR